MCDGTTARRVAASEAERAAILALKNRVLAAPSESAFADEIVMLRFAAAIASVSEAALEQRGRKG